MTFFHEQTGHLRTWARRTLWCVFVTGALCAIVIPIFSIYRREGDNARSVVEVGPQGVSHTGDYIHVVGTVASVDFEDKNFRVHFEFTPHGTLAGDDGILSGGISISLFYTTLTFPEGQIMRSVDVTMPYMQGATIDYPFDAYKSYFEILANKEKEQLHKIPVSLTFLGMLQSVEFIPKVKLSSDELYKISIEIYTRRSPTTIGFSLFIVLIMWLLSIAIGIIAIQVIQKHRISDEHVLTLGITTLFALPALRETQPGIPAIGCAADVLGFYWNMAIIAISSIMILMASALRWKEPSIEKELDMVRKQHDYQSKLIQEMGIPMPFPLTGGPFYDYQVKHKRMPFMTEGHLAQQHVHHRQPQHYHNHHPDHHHQQSNQQQYDHAKHQPYDQPVSLVTPLEDRKEFPEGCGRYGHDHPGWMYQDHGDLDLASLPDAADKREMPPFYMHDNHHVGVHCRETGGIPNNIGNQDRQGRGGSSCGASEGSVRSTKSLNGQNDGSLRLHLRCNPPPLQRFTTKQRNGSSKSSGSRNDHSGSSTLGTQRGQRSRTMPEPLHDKDKEKAEGTGKEKQELMQDRRVESKEVPSGSHHNTLTILGAEGSHITFNGARYLGHFVQTPSNHHAS
ncbi:hypothetical protein BGX31_005159 [Mortierella sp. GBA43]|nr:hypothetical protein BGX31_005159 [Mortierella sp. GBA43]